MYKNTVTVKEEKIAGSKFIKKETPTQVFSCEFCKIFSTFS